MQGRYAHPSTCTWGAANAPQDSCYAFGSLNRKQESGERTRLVFALFASTSSEQSDPKYDKEITCTMANNNLKQLHRSRPRGSMHFEKA